MDWAFGLRGSIVSYAFLSDLFDSVGTVVNYWSQSIRFHRFEVHVLKSVLVLNLTSLIFWFALVSVFYEGYLWELLFYLFLELWNISFVLLLLVCCGLYLTFLQLFTQLFLNDGSQFILHNDSAFRHGALLCMDVDFKMLWFLVSFICNIYGFDPRLFGKFQLIPHLIVGIDPQLATVAKYFVCFLSHHPIFLFFEVSLAKVESFIYVFELGIFVYPLLHF